MLVAIESVTAPAERPDGGETAITAEVRVENRTGEEAESPEVLLTCGGEEQAFYGESTYESVMPIPPGSFYEGTRVMEQPEGCERPTIVAYMNFSIDDDPVGHWPL